MNVELITIQLKELNEKLSCLLEINQSILKQNLKLSEELYGKVKHPDPPSSPEEKELYYCVFDTEHVLIHGPGTYNNKDKIKTCENAEWDKGFKAWKVKIQEDKLLELFKNISLKTLFPL